MKALVEHDVGAPEPAMELAMSLTVAAEQLPPNQPADDTVPIGVEALVALASVDEEFAEALFQDRDSAMGASGIRFTVTERAILRAMDPGTLRRMVAETGSRGARFPHFS